MKKNFLLLFSITAFFNFCIAQTTNKGTEFWVGYAPHRYMQDDNTQNMTLYLSADNLPAGVGYATVTIIIDSSGATPSLDWKRVYHIPNNTVIAIDNSSTPAFSFSPSTALSYGPMPKGTLNTGISHTSPYFDARLYTAPAPTGTYCEGLFRKKGIHIESDYPIVAYSHIYSGVSSGATMLLPVSNWGNSYKTINNNQAYSDSSNSFFYVMASQDNTPIKIVPSQQSQMGKPANVPIYITLNKGQVYQYVGKTDLNPNSFSSIGVQLTGSTVQSLDLTKPIAVFAGSSRTSGELDCGTVGGRENDMQQCFPMEAWGKEYLTVPFSSATSYLYIYPSLFSPQAYKVIARDTGTYINLNNSATKIPIPVGGFYKIINNLPNKIVANKPIMVAEFMEGGCLTGMGDEEMVYLSPIDRGVTQAGFYRNTKEAIQVNYVALVVPNDGLSSLKIDGNSFPQIGGDTTVFKHPNDTNYTVVIKGWVASQSQCVVKCNKRFTGITYGLGNVESYGYNVGGNFYLQTPNINPTPKVNIKGLIYCDANNNGHYDSSETLLPNVKVQLGNSGNNNYVLSNANGEYAISLDSISAGLYTFWYTSGIDTLIKAIYLPNSILDTTITYNISLCSSLPNVNNLSINAIPLYMSAAAGQPYPYFVQYTNFGTSTLSPVVSLNYNDYLLSYDSCSDATVVPTTTGVLKSVLNFAPAQTKSFVPYFTIKSSANIGDTLKTVYAITDNATGTTTADSFYVLIDNSYNPIAQAARPAISPTQVANGTGIDYTISFRNTGTFKINDVRITDTLSNLLNAGTVKVLSSSYPCKATIKGNKVLFEMIGINLLDSNISKFKSIGFIKFRVMPKSSVVVGDIITNKASVYFDFENVLNTNPVSTVVNVTGVITPLKFTLYDVHWSGDKKIENVWQTTNEINVSHFNIQRSANGKDFETIGKQFAYNQTTNNYSFIDEKLPTKTSNKLAIYYRVQSIDKDGKISYSETRIVTLNPQAVSSFSLFPNPARDYITIESIGIKEVKIINQLGQVTVKQFITEQANSIQSKTINIQSLQKGLYVVQATGINGDIKNEKLIIE